MLVSLSKTVLVNPDFLVSQKAYSVKLVTFFFFFFATCLGRGVIIQYICRLKSHSRISVQGSV